MEDLGVFLFMAMAGLSILYLILGSIYLIFGLVNYFSKLEFNKERGKKQIKNWLIATIVLIVGWIITGGVCSLFA